MEAWPSSLSSYRLSYAGISLYGHYPQLEPNGGIRKLRRFVKYRIILMTQCFRIAALCNTFNVSHQISETRPAYSPCFLTWLLKCAKSKLRNMSISKGEEISPAVREEERESCIITKALTVPYPPCNHYHSYWTRLHLLRILLRTAKWRESDCMSVKHE